MSDHNTRKNPLTHLSEDEVEAKILGARQADRNLAQTQIRQPHQHHQADKNVMTDAYT
jgi:hypothetical protein